MIMNEFSQRIVFMGTPDFAADILKGLIEAGFNIVGAVTQPDKEVGRKRVLTPSSVKTMAKEYGIPVITPAKIRNEYEEVLSLDPEIVVTAAYGQIIPEEILNYPKYRCINAHGSLLPKYRGGAPIQRAIINGEKETGITIMYMSKGMDEGDMICQCSCPIEMDDTNATMFNKLSKLALKMLIETLPKIFNGEVNATAQDNDEASYAPNLPKEIEHIFFDRDVLEAYNHIRGLLDNPGCFFMIKDKKYKITKASFEYCDDAICNTFAGLENDYLRLDCQNGFIKVYEIKPEGKNAMDAKSFYNGTGRNLVGEHLG